MPLHPPVRARVDRSTEQLATAHLVAGGLVVLDRRWRCARGQLDLVARDGRTLVFVEFAAGSPSAGPGATGVPARSARIRRLAAAWLAASDRAWPEVRFDLVAVSRPLTGPAVVDHRRGVL